MEQRYSMQFFLEEYHGKEETEMSYFYLENDDHLYGGRELLLDDRKITYYFLPIDKGEALMFLYVGDDIFDEAVNNIDRYNKGGLKNAFPLFMRALNNGEHDNYSSTALIKLPHLNKDGSFWCFATKVENVDFSNMETEYVIGKLGKLYSDVIDIFNQLEENEVSFWDQLVGAGRAGFDGWRIAKTALNIGGLFFGVNLLGSDS